MWAVEQHEEHLLLCLTRRAHITQCVFDYAVDNLTGMQPCLIILLRRQMDLPRLYFTIAQLWQGQPLCLSPPFP